MSIDRHRSRILAMQALCQWEVQKDDSTEPLREMMIELEAAESDIAHALMLFESVRNRQEEIDANIGAVSEHWDLGRISAVERNIMRVAVVEWMTGQVPWRVALAEAIEIAREYGAAKSSGFVNGVLDAVHKRLESAPEEGEPN